MAAPKGEAPQAVASVGVGECVLERVYATMEEVDQGSSISLISDIGLIRLLLGGPKKGGGGYLKNDT